MSRQIRGRPGTLFVLNRSFVEEVRHVGVRDATIATGWSVAALMTALLISSHKPEWLMEAGSSTGNQQAVIPSHWLLSLAVRLFGDS